MAETTPDHRVDETPSYAPFTSRLERLAWRISMGSLIGLLVIMVGLWE